MKQTVPAGPREVPEEKKPGQVPGFVNDMAKNKLSAYYQGQYDNKQGMYNDLNKNYKDVYDSLANRTQQQNSRNIANANYQAAQQSALAGYNPEMAAAMSNRMLSAAYGANQQANQGVNDMALETEQKIAQNNINLKEHEELINEKQRGEYLRQIDEIEKTRPDLAAQMRLMLTLGQDDSSGQSQFDLSEFFDSSGNIIASDKMRAEAEDFQRQTDAALSVNKIMQSLKSSGTIDSEMIYNLPGALKSDTTGTLTSALANKAKAYIKTGTSEPQSYAAIKDAKAGDVFILNGNPIILTSRGDKYTTGNWNLDRNRDNINITYIDGVTGQPGTATIRKKQ